MFQHIHHELVSLPRIDSPEGRFYQTPDGIAYPSVTTITGQLGKEAIIAWRKKVGNEEANRISSRAAARGTRIHKLCEDVLNNKTVDAGFFDAPLWADMRPLLNDITEVHALEKPLYSHHLKVAGTVDCVAKYQGKMSIVDFKTSKRLKTREDISNYFMQCSAYAVAFEERTGIAVSQLVILMGVDDEAPLVFIEKRDDWIGKFLELREQYAISHGK
jgi:genome maintenance exonuclease 1